MKVEKLVRDASGCGAGESMRQCCMVVAQKLAAKFEDHEVKWSTVKRWVERGSLPGFWLAELLMIDPHRPLSIEDYYE